MLKMVGGGVSVSERQLTLLGQNQQCPPGTPTCVEPVNRYFPLE